MDINKKIVNLLLIISLIVCGAWFSFAAMSGNTATTVNILGAAAVDVAPATLNLSDIKVTAGFLGANCTFQTFNNALFNQAGCDAVPPNAQVTLINITNIGSTTLSINLNSTQNATTLFAPYSGDPVTPPVFQFNATATNKPGSCDGNMPTPLHDLGPALQPFPVCDSLNYTVSKNQINLGLKLTVPVEAVPGERSATISIFATEV
jgi:hypothetical protein